MYLAKIKDSKGKEYTGKNNNLFCPPDKRK